MKVLALVISLVIASTASSWAAEVPKERFNIKCQENGKVLFQGKDFTIDSRSIPGRLVVKTVRGYTVVILVGGGQCVLVETTR